MSDSPLRGIFFDLGNVLVGIDSARFAEKMRILTGLEFGRLRSIFAGGLVSDYECGRMGDDEFLAGLCDRAGVAVTRDDFTDAWTCMFRKTPILPEELLKDLARRHLLWAISNTNRMHFEFIREHYRFLKHFRGWSLSYDVGVAKPDPAIFAHALEKTRIPSSHALFVDDQLINVEGARNLGIDAIQFLNPAQLIEELRTRNLMTNYELRITNDE
jgi:FMN phosphatase YigB (HAD superfamily)